MFDRTHRISLAVRQHGAERRVDRIDPVRTNLRRRTNPTEHDTSIRGSGSQCHCDPLARMKSNSPAPDSCFQRLLRRRRDIPQHATDFYKVVPWRTRTYFRSDFASNHALLPIVALVEEPVLLGAG